LNFFKDVDAKKVEFGFNEPDKPVKISTDKNVMAILTPIRMY
jgi:DNA polymerase III sliding clamp (beta) subunit (PCNA family)